MKLLWVLLASVLIAGCSSSGKDPDYLAAQVAAHNKTADEGDKIVCKYVSETGTFIKKRKCRTVSQIQEELNGAQQTMGRITSGGTNSSSGEN